jgi:hypothetical protein
LTIICTVRETAMFMFYTVGKSKYVFGEEKKERENV